MYNLYVPWVLESEIKVRLLYYRCFIALVHGLRTHTMHAQFWLKGWASKHYFLPLVTFSLWLYSIFPHLFESLFNLLLASNFNWTLDTLPLFFIHKQRTFYHSKIRIFSSNFNSFLENNLFLFYTRQLAKTKENWIIIFVVKMIHILHYTKIYTWILWPHFYKRNYDKISSVT